MLTTFMFLFYSNESPLQNTSAEQPIYESPPPKYSAERLLEILLDPSIPYSKVCKEKPTGVTCSATYVVDTRNLKCLDDIKKDDFGIWNYSGSHPVAYKVKFKQWLYGDREVWKGCCWRKCILFATATLYPPF